VKNVHATYDIVKALKKAHQKASRQLMGKAMTLTSHQQCKRWQHHRHLFFNYSLPLFAKQVKILRSDNFDKNLLHFTKNVLQ